MCVFFYLASWGYPHGIDKLENGLVLNKLKNVFFSHIQRFVQEGRVVAFGIGSWRLPGHFCLTLISSRFKI